MLSTLASLLFLGVVPMQSAAVTTPALPGIRVLTVSSPVNVSEEFQMPQLSASGVLLLDADSGQEIFSIDADTPRPMASLAKIMTALVLIERHKPEELVTIPPLAEEIKGSTIDVIKGQHLSVGDLLKALLLPSANDAAYALALHESPSISAFVHAMNERAKVLGLKQTRFVNPAGLDAPDQQSTAREIAWLSLAALKHPLFKQTVNTRSARIYSKEGNDYALRNTNELLHYNEDVFGVKTGTTTNAGECLVVLFQKRSRRYLLVLLHSADRYTDALKVLSAVHKAAS